MLIVGSGPFTPDPPGQLDVLGHDGHPLSVNSLQTEDDEMVDRLTFKNMEILTQRLVSSKRPTRYASLASCSAMTAEL